MPGIDGSYTYTFSSPPCSSTGGTPHIQQPPERYYSSYPSPGIASPHFSTTGQGRQINQQPTQQYYGTMSPSSSPLTTVPIPGIRQTRQTIQQPTEQYYSSYPPPGIASPHFSTTGQARQINQQPAQQYYGTMSPSSYPLTTAPIPGIRQTRQTIQQPTEQYYTPVSISPPSAVNTVSHSIPQSSTIPSDDELIAPGRPDYRYHQNTMSSLRSRYPSQSDFLGSSTSANLRDRSFAPPGRRRIAESPDVNTATNPLGFAADPSSHVLGVSIDAANNSNGASNDSEATSAPSSSTHTQANDSMIDNAAGQHFLAAKFIPFEMMPNNAPSPQTAYTHPPATNMNQPTGYGSSFHNPQSFHSTHRKTVTRSNLMPSSSLHVPYLRYHIPPNTGPASSSSYRRSFAHDSGAQHGSLPAGPPYQPAPPMAPSQPIHRNPPSRPSSGRYRRTQTQKTYPLPSKIRCYWLDEDNTPCPFKGSFDDLKKHFKNSHLSGAQNSLGRCRWQDCQYQKRADPTVHYMRRDCVWRHVREKHLKIKRV